MNCLRHYFQMLVLVGLPAFGLVCGLSARAQTLLSAEDIIQRTVQRGESPGSFDSRPNYRYTKHTVTDELDTRGHLRSHKDRLYEVLVESGLSYLKLIQLNGQNLSADEMKKQEERDAAERQKIMDAKPGGKGDNRENFLTADVVERFKFTLLEQKPFNGRTAYLLAFEPKSADLPVRKLTDRFLNQAAGTVWIDAEDFEIARIEVHLKSEVALWGGVIGTLRQCRFTMERTRLADGIWFNSLSHGVFEGRKLLEPVFIRTRSTSTDFRRVALALQ